MSQVVGNAAASEAAKRILIIEDDAVVARLYQNRLRKEGYRVDIASEGQEGFFTILKDKPDGVLLDLMLPNMDGIQILRKTRAQKQFESMPIIVFSNAYINGMLDEAVAAGASRVFNKSDPGTTQNIVAGFMEAFFPMRARELRAHAAEANAGAFDPANAVDPGAAATGGTMMFRRQQAQQASAAPQYEQAVPVDPSAPAGGTMSFRRANSEAAPAGGPPGAKFVAPAPRFGAIPVARQALNANGAASGMRPPQAPTAPRPPAPLPIPTAAPPPPAPLPVPPPAPPPATPLSGLRMASAQPPAPLPVPPPPAAAPQSPMPSPPMPPPTLIIQQASAQSAAGLEANSFPQPQPQSSPQSSGQTIFLSKNAPLLPTANNSPGPLQGAPDTAFVPVTPEVAAMHEEFVKVFFEGGPETMSGIRKSLRAYSKEPSTPAGQAQLNGFYRKVHSLTGAAGMASLESIGNFSACLEALLREILLNSVAFQPSTLRTLASAVDLLGIMFDKGPGCNCPIPTSPVVLVVDDDVLSRRAVTFGLEKARLKSAGTADPHHALKEMEKNSFELIFLDVDMPDMDGFELCTRIRRLPAYAKTPVVFITGMTDFQTRAKSITSGGNDFISKPLCFIELAVKALTFVLKGRLAGQETEHPQPL